MTTNSSSRLRFIALSLAMLALTTVSRMEGQTVFFSDTFNRADSTNLDVTTNGMSGLLISSGTLSAGGVWSAPADIAWNNGSNSMVAANQLRIGGWGHSIYIFPNFNFANLVSTGIVSVSMILTNNGPGGTGTGTYNYDRYNGIGVGFSLAAGNGNGGTGQWMQNNADLFVQETSKGAILVYDGAAAGRGTGANYNLAVPLAAPATAYLNGTLRIDLMITNTIAGSNVVYNVLWNSGSGFTNVVTGRSFNWSGTSAFYVGTEERSTPSLTNDNFTVSASSYSSPPASGLVWRATANNTWDTTSIDWVDNGAGIDSYAFFTGAAVTFNDNTASATVNVPAAVTPGSMTFNNTVSNYIVSGTGPITGSGSLSKSGVGTLTLSLSNSYAGGTTISAGRILVGNNNALGSGSLTLSGGSISSDGGTARAVANATQITSTTTIGDAVANGLLSFSNSIDFGGAGRTLILNSDAVFAGGATDGILASKQGTGTLTINGTVNYSGAADTQNGKVIYSGATVTSSDRLIADAGGVNGIARLVITNGTSVTITTAVGNLRSGRSASSGSNYVDLAGLYILSAADSVDGYATLYGNAAYSEMTFWPGGDFTARGVTNTGGSGNTVFKFNGGILRARNTNVYFFQGLSQALVQAGGANIDDGGFAITINQNLLNGGGGGGLNKLGAGLLLLNGNNTYLGPTIATSGTLGGGGTLSGPVEISSGASLDPGGIAGAAGTLTINSNLTLDAGSFVSVEINKATSATDLVNVLKNISYSGTLVVTNISNTPFASGDTFTLFNASGTKSGNFSAVNILPVTGLIGNFNPTNGVLTIGQAAAGSDFYTVSGNSVDNIFSVLTNDIGTDLTLVGVSTPLNGSALVSDTNIIYTPDTGFVGVDTFLYTNQDILGSNTVLTVTVTVAPVLNLNDSYQVLRNSYTNTLDVLRNDGPGMSLISITQPTNGTAYISGTNIIYIPTSNYFGPDSFTYTEQNGSSVTNTSTVTLDVRQYPNFLFILADDQGWTGLSTLTDTNVYNSKSDYYSTPRMETLASQSLRFSYGYSPHPDCSPSRYANLTGKTPARVKMTDIVGRNDTEVSGMYKLITPGKLTNFLLTNDLTTAQLLKAIPGANYSAAHFGKWHLDGGGPVMHGFDADANDGATDNSTGNVGPTPINPDPKLAYSVTDRAINYLVSRVTNGTPFYLQVSHYCVHENTQTTQSSFNSFNGKPWGVWHTNQWYAGMTLDLDINVGRVLDELDQLGIRNSTYVIYQSDNGAPQAQSENYPLRRYKPEIWEGGTRVPTFFRGPGIPANVQCDVPVCGIDIMPTIMQWATGSTSNLPPDIDGGSLVPLINSLEQGVSTNLLPAVVRGGELVAHEPHYVGPLPWPNDWQILDKDMRPRSSIHSGHYKLVAEYEPGTIELYDLDSDISEQTNLSPAQLAIKWQLWVRLRDYLKMVNAQMPTLDPTYPGTTNGSFVLLGATGPLGDADSDGLPDSWEFSELLTYQYSGTDDPSQSGLTLAQDYAQNLDPLVPNAYRINTITPVGTNQLSLTWNSTPGASFTVEVSSNLVNWVPAQTVTAGNVFYGNATISLTGPQDFFRVRKL